MLFFLFHFRKEVGLDLFFPQQLINSIKVNGYIHFYVSITVNPVKRASVSRKIIEFLTILMVFLDPA